MGVVVRPRFGRPCYNGCGATVPTQRLNELAARAHKSGESLAKSDCICVDCEAERERETTTIRRPRR